MNKHISRKFHTSASGQRTRIPVTYETEKVKVFSTVPFISFDKAKKMIVQWGYNLDEVLSYKDKQGRFHQTSFNQYQMLALQKLELACKELHLVKQQVKTVFKDRTSQLYFTVEYNERQIKQDPIHWEIVNLFASNNQLKQYSY
mgnify:CR=1 FL=1